MKKTSIIILCLAFVFLSQSCDEDPAPPVDSGDLTDIEYNPEFITLTYPEYQLTLEGFNTKVPEMNIPEDNPLTEEGVDLGRHLFYDKMLSDDFTMSCSTCHLPEGSFTDNKAVSVGIDGIAGRRSSMSLLNIGFVDQGLFWDGRSMTLEDQALLPVEDEIELHTSWDTVITRLKNSTLYPSKFRKAFGIANKSDITKELAAKAIAQFERSLYSLDSKFDKFMKGEVQLTDDELWGYEMFIHESEGGAPDAQCIHCHSLPLMTSNAFFNNGLQAAETVNDFEDPGSGKGFFRAPTLRNIELTAPYMHDGSMNTLEEVIEHYNSGGKVSPNRDPLLTAINLTDYDKQALKAFLLTLTDQTFLEKSEIQDPFK